MPPHSGFKDQYRHGKILVVDDDKRFRTLIQTMLSQAGYEVWEAENGHAAIEVLRKKISLHSDVPDLILCDIRMPVMDGVEAITVFRRDFPTVPVAVLTGFPDIEMAAMLLDKGISDYTLKPIEREKLLAVIDRALAGKPALNT